MRVTVAKRLLDVEQHLASVALSGQLAPLEVRHSNDEIGSLVDHLNDMLIQLKDLREQVEIQSFKLGKTESAVGVMHNVRNGLNPVSVILARASDYNSAVSVADVVRAVEELQSPETGLERRIKLASFLKVALTAQLELRQEGLEEIQTARRCLAEVVDMIGQQQELAHEAVETELCDLGDVIRQNAALARYAKSHSVEFKLSDMSCSAVANRILLSQVVGNLFSNAVEAITSASRSKGLVEVSYVNKSPWLEIHVRDNGEGFEAGTVKRFFERGFSTRKEKSGGLGLHWCANALNLMNGQLELVSDGPGLGATAIIRLPEASAPARQSRPASEDRAQSHPDHDSAVARQALGS
jgi:signal transduction histidine kinase